MEMERARGKEEGVYGVAESGVVETEGKSMTELGEDRGGNRWWGGKELHTHRDTNTHTTRKRQPHCSTVHPASQPVPISPLPLCVPKAGADGFLYLSFAAVG